MGIWLEILRLGAGGDAAGARELLENKLPLGLRSFVPSASGSREYTGPVPEAVSRYISQLPVGERALARFHEYDLVDYIVDDVVAAVARTLLLVEFVLVRPDSSLEELVEIFPWDPELKRKPEWKERRVAKIIRSVIAAGIPLPFDNVGSLDDGTGEVYSLNEMAFAASTKRIEQSWWDFKRQQDLDAYFLSVVDSDSGEGVGSEAVDYGSVSIAKIVLGTDPGLDRETVLDLHMLGAQLGPELTELMEEMHVGRPRDGYRPIAWHNVFWCVTSDYEGLRMSLKTERPYCEKDQELSDHLADNYRDVESTSRPVIYRRRRALHEACEERVLTRMRERFKS